MLGRWQVQEGIGWGKYDKQFKEEAVQLVTEGDRQVTDVARSLGIHENLQHTWERKHQDDPYQFLGRPR